MILLAQLGSVSKSIPATAAQIADSGGLYRSVIALDLNNRAEAESTSRR